MLPPPPQGDPVEALPPGIGNPEVWTVKLTWDACRTFGGQALPEFIQDMAIIGGTPV